MNEVVDMTGEVSSGVRAAGVEPFLDQISRVGLDVRPLEAAKSTSERIWHGGIAPPRRDRNDSGRTT